MILLKRSIIRKGFVLLYIICSTVSQDCLARRKYNSKTHDDSLTFSSNESIWFELDNTSSPETYSIDVFPKSNPKFLFFNHSQSNSISIFDIESGKLDKKIILETEGPNGVGDNVLTGIYVQSFDSIFFLSILSQQLYLINSSAQVINHYNLYKGDGYAKLGTLHPAFLENNQLHFNAYPTPMLPISSKNFGSIKLDLVTKKVRTENNLSSKYDDGSWGRHHYLRIHQTYNPHKKITVISNPNDQNVYVYKEEKLLSTNDAGAELIKKLKPLAKRISEVDDASTFKSEANQGSYSAIYYDRFRKLYYRFAFNPIGRKYRSPLDTESNVSIIILNDKFEKVGEYYLKKDTYNLGALFITEQGLFIQNKTKYLSMGNEDRFPFDKFIIKSIN